MAVIGRLDGQVDAVLITPLKRKGEPDEDERAQRSERAEQVAQTTRTSRERSSEQTDADELPVWLL
jgi:hypothetical protein